MIPSVSEIMLWLEEVKDPEIPVLSIVDMGIIREIETDGDRINITITPTFVGCPALDMIKSEITSSLHSRGFSNVEVKVSFRKPWTSDDITERGRIAIKKFGLAPPMTGSLITDIGILDHAPCPRCDGTNTELKSPFGATLCRSIHFCLDCKESFEQFKPV